MFSIELCRSFDHGKVISHLPLKISRPTKCLIDHCSTDTVIVWSKNVGRSLLCYGELEILSRVKLVMPKTLEKQFLVDSYGKMM